MSSDVLHLSPQQLVPLMPVLDALNDGMLIVDASGSVIAVNKAMRRLYHGGEVPYPGYPLSDFNAADWVEAKRVLTSGKPLLGQIMHLPAATVVASHLPIVHQGTVTGVVCAMQEIASLDDIVHKLQAYRELDAQLNGLLEALPQGVIVCDAKEHILRANTAGCRLCGREYGVVQGGSLEDLSADFKELAEGMRACLSSGLPSQSLVRHGEQSLFLWIVPILGESKSPDLVAATLVELDRFDALRVQLEAPERPAEEQVAGMDDGDMVQSVAAEVGMVVRSASIRRVVSRAIKVSQTDSSVLLQGESGTGKSMLASIIHKLSPRKNAPFVSINCGAIPEQLMESELFGYERGAFTGASPKGKTGLLEAAQGGTVFFDEIGELPLTMQVKLLEVLDRHAFLRIGGIKPVAVDVRIVAATNRNLEEEVEKGSFRRGPKPLPQAPFPRGHRPSALAPLSGQRQGAQQHHGMDAGHVRRLPPAPRRLAAFHAYVSGKCACRGKGSIRSPWGLSDWYPLEGHSLFRGGGLFARGPCLLFHHERGCTVPGHASDNSMAQACAAQHGPGRQGAGRQEPAGQCSY